ncbi:extracellular solute-binding protein, family 1 [Candidatus Moduliflexus flocculans]|uniref:Extracellular solute-binding protein, family 1 n=1 Tax=Candidatus Moduliflexus flocculans TaxID=1499966 RepID=A0A081BT87_9BACT|nr:extracellular solute-binding protein, family 1 [Candidatus Moduliflexus flocculans]
MMLKRGWIVALMLAGCMLSAAAAWAEPSGEITVWGWPTHDRGYEAIIAGFNAKYPNVKVNWIMQTGAGGCRDSLSTALAAGEGLPDVTGIEINDIGRFVMQGGFVDLLQPPYNAGKYEKDFVAYKWQQGLTPDGRLLAFPWDIGPASVFYRRDLFEKAGLPSDPESVQKMMSTWKDFIEVSKKVADPDNDVYALMQAEQIPYIYYAHKNFFDKDYNVAINNQKTLEVLQYAKQIRELGLDAKAAQLWNEEWYNMLRNGQVAFTIIGCWFGSFLKSFVDPDGAGNWGMVPVPEDPLQNWGGSFLAIPEKAPNKEAAWAFVEYALATAEGQNGIFKAVDYFPSYIPAWQDPIYQEGDPYFGGQKTRDLWMKIATSPGTPFTTPMDSVAEVAFMAEVTKMLNENLEPQAAIAAAEKSIAEQTAKDRELVLQLLKK